MDYKGKTLKKETAIYLNIAIIDTNKTNNIAINLYLSFFFML